MDQESRAAYLITILKMATTHSMFEDGTIAETWAVLHHKNFILVCYFMLEI